MHVLSLRDSTAEDLPPRPPQIAGSTGWSTHLGVSRLPTLCFPVSPASPTPPQWVRALARQRHRQYPPPPPSSAPRLVKRRPSPPPNPRRAQLLPRNDVEKKKEKRICGRGPPSPDAIRRAARCYTVELDPPWLTSLPTRRRTRCGKTSTGMFSFVFSRISISAARVAPAPCPSPGARLFRRAFPPRPITPPSTASDVGLVWP